LRIKILQRRITPATEHFSMSEQPDHLDYAEPDESQARFGAWALAGALVGLAMVVFVRLEGQDLHNTRPVPPYWPVIETYAWLPAVLGLGLAITALATTRRKRWLSYLALAIVAVSLALYISQPLYR
jgi:hypothetical protein